MLTDLACKRAVPGEKEYRLADELGMYLLVMPSGHRSWRMGYWFAKQKKRLVLGSYPDLPLKDARAARDRARALIAKGIDPALHKKQEAARQAIDSAITFKVLAEQWLDERRPGWSKSYTACLDGIFRNHLYPHWGALPFSSISKAMVAQRLKAIEARGTIETAKRARQKINELRGWAEELGYEVQGTGKINAGLMPTEPTLRPAITNLEMLRTFLRTVEAAPAHPITRICSRLIALTAMRPGVVQQLPWTEIDAIDPADPIWIVPAARMKLSQSRKRQEAFDHVTPMSRQAMELFDVLRPLTGHSAYCFPSTITIRRPMSDSTVSKLYRDNGYRGLHVPHGWRSSFSTIMNERAMLAERPGDRVVIDLMLGHVQPGVEQRYNRSSYIPRRRELAQEWADLLLEGFPPASSLLLGPRN